MRHTWLIVAGLLYRPHPINVVMWADTPIRTVDTATMLVVICIYLNLQCNTSLSHPDGTNL